MLSAILLALALSTASGAEPGERKELGRVQKELEAARREMQEFKKAEESLKSDLERLERGSREARRKMEEIEGNRRRAEARRRELSLRLGDLRAAADFWKGALSVELRHEARAALVAPEGRSGWDDGATGLWEEAFRRGALVQKAGLLQQLHGSERKAEAAAAEAGSALKAIGTRARQAQEQEKSLQSRYEFRRQEYAQTQEKMSAAARRVRELEESAKSLTRLLQQRSRPRAVGARAPVLDVAKRSLPWPVAGKVVSEFGRQRHPVLGSWVFHDGIRVETEPGAQVAPVAAGRVIFSGPFRSYGRVVIVDHGADFFSVYGELGELLRAKGDRVSPGEAVGTSGTGGGGRGSLYLELRRGAAALNPLVWLKDK